MYREDGDSMFWSWLSAVLVCLMPALLLFLRRRGKRREKLRIPAFTVIPLLQNIDPRELERLVRAFWWENSFGGGMRRQIVLVSLGSESTDREAFRLAGELEGIKIIRAEQLDRFLKDQGEYSDGK